MMNIWIQVGYSGFDSGLVTRGVTSPIAHYRLSLSFYFF
jgi:hypothetical protein